MNPQSLLELLLLSGVEKNAAEVLVGQLSGVSSLAKENTEGGVTKENRNSFASGNVLGSGLVQEILASGAVDETHFAQTLAERFSLPFEPLQKVQCERAALSALPAKFIFKHQLLPLSLSENRLRLATWNPLNTTARQLASQLISKPVVYSENGKTSFHSISIDWCVAPRTALMRTLKNAYGVGAETFEELLQNSRGFDSIGDGEAMATDLNADDPEASVVKFVNQILREALHERATDIHVEPLENDLRIRYRIDGILHEVAVPPQLRLLQSAIISRLKVMARMDIAEKRLPQDGRINLQHSGTAIDVRVSTIPTVTGESISLRLLNRDETRQFSFERLDLSASQRDTVQKLLREPNGILLVTGPTGSGKSTSLYSFLSAINSPERRIVTIEEPVEYRLPGVSQIDVKPEIGLTFAGGLRAILRQDPNVVMVGEIRDQETAEIAIRAAMTGHLVFSTLHTNDAVGGITRLLDMGVEPFLIASVVRAFVAQRLVRTLCPACARPVEYPAEHLAEIGCPPPEMRGEVALSMDTRHAHGSRGFLRGAGCDACRQTGYQGRAAIYEFCLIGQEMRRLIMQKATGNELKTCATRHGMTTLRQDGWRRVHLGQTSVEEVLRVTQNDEDSQ